MSIHTHISKGGLGVRANETAGFLWEGKVVLACKTSLSWPLSLFYFREGTPKGAHFKDTERGDLLIAAEFRTEERVLHDVCRHY